MLAIKLDQLCYTYADGTKALRQISLSVQKNTRLAILGANGSGKTTLLYHLNGLHLPQEGQVHILGQQMEKKNAAHIRRQVALLFDNPDQQLFGTTVYEDIAFGPRNMGLTQKEITARVDEAIRTVQIEPLAHKPIHHLSWGQKKRVAIAGLLAMQPNILVCDEPFTGLDPQQLTSFLLLLKQLHQQGTTLIISTHDVDVAYAWADQVVVMKAGHILAEGEPSLLTNATLMAEAALQLPMLATIFNPLGYYPRTPEEAADMLKKIMKPISTN
jgi:cobalt/nickel transport system ATP-binding protein